jgi:hypothetical protein
MTISSTAQAMAALDRGQTWMSTEHRQQLDKLGYCVFKLDPQTWDRWGVNLDKVRAVVDRLSAEEGWKGGLEGKHDFIDNGRPLEAGAVRLGNLVEKNSVFRRMAVVPPVLEASHYIAGEIKLSSLNYRDPKPGSGAQRLHVDWIARQSADEPYGGCICFLYLDDVTLENGPARVVPGSHKTLNWPDAYVDVMARHPDEVYLTAKAGWLVAVNLHLWHSGTDNNSGGRRRVLNITYRRRDVPQFLDPRRFLSPKTLESLSPAETYLYSVRDEDPVQEAENFGPGAAYREWLARQESGQGTGRAEARR